MMYLVCLIFTQTWHIRWIRFLLKEKIASAINGLRVNSKMNSGGVLMVLIAKVMDCSFS